MTFRLSGPGALCAAAISLLPLPAIAEQAETVEDIDKVTIIGRKADALDVPGSAHVIDSQELEAFAHSDVLRVLRTVPGVYVQEEEGFGLRPNIGIRGSGLDRSARIALLEDGLLIAPAPYAASAAYYFPTQRRMHGVEVLKGPAAVAVGPRTTGGALNLVSTPIPAAFAGMLDVRAGNHNTIDAHLNVGRGSDRISWLLETVQAKSDGYKSIDGPVGGDTGFNIKDYVAKLQIDSDSSSDVKQSLRIKLGYTDQESDETYVGLTRQDFLVDPNRRYAASANDNFQSEHEQYQATYAVDTGNNWRAEATAYRNDFTRNWYKLQSVAGQSLDTVLSDPITYATELGFLQGETSADNDLLIRANNRRYYSQGVQASVEWDLAFGNADIVLDVGFRLHEDEEDRFQHQDGYRMDDGTLVLTTKTAAGSQANRVSDAKARSIFVNTELRHGAWIFTPGVRYEEIKLRRIDFSTTDPSRTNGPDRVRNNTVSVVIPGVGALYRLNNDWRLLAGVHKGYNPPSPGSSASEETSLNIEAGARFDNDALNLEALYFRNDYDNLVGTVTDSTGGGGQIGDQFDGGEVVVQGLELSMSVDFDQGDVAFPLSLQYTWTLDAEFENTFESDFDPWGNVASGDQLPYIPEHQFRATAGIAAERYNLNLAANFVDRMRTRAGQGEFDPRSTIDSHVVWDLVGSWNFSENFSVYVKVDNLLDNAYVAAGRPAGLRPGLPRTAYLGITYRLL